ncbi:MAG: glycosyltransferase family 4 protein [Patescibacteria group bacterium]
MKILQVNKFLYPRGGAEAYLFNLSRLLTGHGHEIIYFSQKNPKNINSGQEKYFLTDWELGRFSLRSAMKIPRMFWSLSARRKISRLIKADRPQIVHLHNIYHQLSPSILPVLKQAGLPIVMTVHDFKLVKPDYTLRADNKPTKHKNSSLIAWILKLEFNFHKLLKIYQNNIDLFIAPSQFVKDQLLKANFKKEKIQILPHFIDLKSYPAQPLPAEDYLLFFGRLDESKGVDLLIRALKEIPDIKLKIAGGGPQEDELKALAAESGLAGRIQFVGRKTGTELTKLIARSLFTVFPSRVHETFGLSILESYGCFKPVVAARVGAVPEIVSEDTGLLFEPDNPTALKNAIMELAGDREKIKKLGLKARELAATKYNPQQHYQALSAIYSQLLNLNN